MPDIAAIPIFLDTSDKSVLFHLKYNAKLLKISIRIARGKFNWLYHLTSTVDFVAPIISAIIGQLVPNNTINVINIKAITPSEIINSFELISKLISLLLILFNLINNAIMASIKNTAM